jgi:flagellar hook protein FlgE
MGFSQGISGLGVAAANLDVIGNNIANSGTVGFKSAAATFQDVYAGSRVGLGASVSGVTQNFTQGVTQTSSRPLDVAILNGDGFYRLSSPSGEVMYSRNGQFTRDKDGYIVNASGLRLTGYGVNASGGINGGTPSPIQIQTAPMTPKATTGNVNAEFNLDARRHGAHQDAVQPGRLRHLQLLERRRPGLRLAGQPARRGRVLREDRRQHLERVRHLGRHAARRRRAADHRLTFDTKGKMTAPASGSLNIGPINFANGSAPLTAKVDLTGTTQFGASNGMNKLSQDGYKSGELTSFSINPDGTITGKFSNEQTKLMGQVVLSSFANPNGLEPKGNNVWAETLASGNALTGTPGEGTKLGSLASGALESSNVDLTSELVNLIVAQRNYQANAQTVKTQDQVMQTLMNIR